MAGILVKFSSQISLMLEKNKQKPQSKQSKNTLTVGKTKKIYHVWAIIYNY
jgi:hypothetical protein